MLTGYALEMEVISAAEGSIPIPRPLLVPFLHQQSLAIPVSVKAWANVLGRWPEMGPQGVPPNHPPDIFQLRMRDIFINKIHK